MMNTSDRAVRGTWRGRMAALVASLAALSGCGGSGGGGGGDGGAAAAGAGAIDVGVRLSATELVRERDVYERRDNPQLNLTLRVDRMPAGGLWYAASHTNVSGAITFVGASPLNDGVDFQILLSSPGTQPRGEYIEEVSIALCTDQVCAQPVVGSPFKVRVRLSVGFYAVAEPGLPSLAVSSARTLPHDVVDAAYSAELDALIVVSRDPGPALHVHDLAGGSRSVALATVPSALSLAPGGLRAAVGHDAAVSVVDLTTLSVRRIPVNQPVGRLVFDGQGRIWAFGAAAFNWNPLIEVDAASGASVEHARVFAGNYGNGVPTLHPDGDRLHFATRGLSPSDVHVMRFGGPGGAPQFADSPYHGDYEVCDRVWIAGNGLRLLTACGVTFTSSADPALDMRYAGTMALSPRGSDFDLYRAVWIDAPANGDDVLLLEQPLLACRPDATNPMSCFTRIAAYDATTLVLRHRQSLPPVKVGPHSYAQLGRMLFTRRNGERLLLSEMRGAEPAAAMRLSVLP